MARESRHLHADALISAIYQASSLLSEPIERLAVRGSIISVEGGGQRIIFRETVSQTCDPSGAPLLGGTSGEAVLVSSAGAEAFLIGKPWDFLRFLPFRRSRRAS